MRANKDMEGMCTREDGWDGWGGVARAARAAREAGLSLSLLVGAIGNIGWMHVLYVRLQEHMNLSIVT